MRTWQEERLGKGPALGMTLLSSPSCKCTFNTSLLDPGWAWDSLTLIWDQVEGVSLRDRPQVHLQGERRGFGGPGAQGLKGHTEHV